MNQQIKTFQNQNHARIFSLQVGGTVKEQESVSYLLPEDFEQTFRQEYPLLYKELMELNNGDYFETAWMDAIDGLPQFAHLQQVIIDIDDQNRVRTTRSQWIVFYNS